MFNYPDGMSGREFDSYGVDCVCPKCESSWEEEVFDQWGPPEQVEVECEECGHEFCVYPPVFDDY